MCVNHDEESAGCVNTKSHEALFTLSVRIFPSQRKVVFKDGDGVGKANAVSLPVRFSFLGIPLESHIPSV
jgi:hypothetical protein